MYQNPHSKNRDIPKRCWVETKFANSNVCEDTNECNLLYLNNNNIYCQFGAFQNLNQRQTKVGGAEALWSKALL